MHDLVSRGSTSGRLRRRPSPPYRLHRGQYRSIGRMRRVKQAQEGRTRRHRLGRADVIATAVGARSMELVVLHGAIMAMRVAAFARTRSRYVALSRCFANDVALTVHVFCVDVVCRPPSWWFGMPAKRVFPQQSPVLEPLKSLRWSVSLLQPQLFGRRGETYSQTHLSHPLPLHPRLCPFCDPPSHP